MKSTELSAALDYCARRLFRDRVAESRPWMRASYVLRAQGFTECWQAACLEAAHELAIPTRDPIFREVYGRRPPTELIDRSGSDQAA